MAKGVKVAAKYAEAAKRELSKLNALDKTLKIKREGDYIIIPIRAEKALPEKFEIVEADFESQTQTKKFEYYLRAFLNKKEFELVRTSYDTIGDIAIVEIPAELQRHEQKIAEALMLAHKSIKAVFKKGGEVKGEERLRELQFLAGENRTETLYKEHGCRFKLDIAKVYFSPRLSRERERILEQTKDEEVIVDLFAGVGPFSILLAKHRDVKVYAIDINRVAIDYLKWNIALNKVEGKVVPLLGNAREVAPRNAATRVIMNLPKSSAQFLDLAFDVIKGGVIHFYAISLEQDLYDSKVNLIKKIAKEKNKQIEIINKRIVRPYSPYHYHVVIDVEVLP